MIKNISKPSSKKSLSKIIPWVYTVGGLVGFVASFVLTIDKINILQNPSYVPPCNINPVISCGSVMTTAQASVFGFTNSLIGVAAFAALIAVGVALLAGASLKKWFWQLAQIIALLGVLLAHWLIFQSLFRIGTLCPYCMVVWLVTIPIFWYTTLHNYALGYLQFLKPKSTWDFMAKHHVDVLFTWYLIIIALVLYKFWYYFKTLV